MVTKAQTASPPTNRSVTLVQENKRLRIDVVAKQLLRLEMLPAKPPTEREHQNEGHSILAVFAEPIDGNVHFHITLTPEQ